jgi:hypothetical protein
MRRITTGILTSIAVVGLLSACSSDSKSTAGSAPANATVPGGGTGAPSLTIPTGFSLPLGVTLPPGLTIPPGGTFPSNLNVVDLLMAQLQAAGMKVDRACLETLLQDQTVRSVVMSGGTPTGEMVQSIMKCLKA